MELKSGNRYYDKKYSREKLFEKPAINGPANLYQILLLEQIAEQLGKLVELSNWDSYDNDTSN